MIEIETFEKTKGISIEYYTLDEESSIKKFHTICNLCSNNKILVITNINGDRSKSTFKAAALRAVNKLIAEFSDYTIVGVIEYSDDLIKIYGKTIADKIIESRTNLFHDAGLFNYNIFQPNNCDYESVFLAHGSKNATLAFGYVNTKSYMENCFNNIYYLARYLVISASNGSCRFDNTLDNIAEEIAKGFNDVYVNTLNKYIIHDKEEE